MVMLRINLDSEFGIQWQRSNSKFNENLLPAFHKEEQSIIEYIPTIALQNNSCLVSSNTNLQSVLSANLYSPTFVLAPPFNSPKTSNSVSLSVQNSHSEQTKQTHGVTNNTITWPIQNMLHDLYNEQTTSLDDNQLEGGLTGIIQIEENSPEQGIPPYVDRGNASMVVPSQFTYLAAHKGDAHGKSAQYFINIQRIGGNSSLFDVQHNAPVMTKAA